MSMATINLEQGMPTVEQARIRLDQAVRSSKSKGFKSLKIIHGYGSSGKGGAIKVDVSKWLASQKRAGRIKNYVAGESFTPFDSMARELLAAEPGLARDRDYARGNAGITIVLL